MRGLNKNTLPCVAISLFGFLAFVQVTFIPVAFYYSSLLFLVATLFIYVAALRVKVEAGLVKYFLLFMSCFLVGIFLYPISMVIEGDKFDYDGLSLVGRLFNLIALFFSVILISAFNKKTSDNNFDDFLVVRWYQVGVLVIMFFGLWQLISFYSFIPFPFETRAHLHSTYGHSYSFTQRLTSIAREPSYFVMLAIDFIGLSLLFYAGLKRRLMVFLGFIMMVFSLSPSGFIAFFGALIGAWFFAGLKFFSGRVNFNKIGLTIFLLVALLLFFVMNEQVFHYVFNRISDATPSNSGRFYMIVMPYFWSLDGSLFSFLFGHGVKSYSVIGSYYSLPSGVPVHATSNNIYTDVFWESGLLGLVLLLLFFAFVFVKIFKSEVGRLYSFVAFYFLFELMLSSLFRADFASARFFILLYLIYLLIKQSSIKRDTDEYFRSAS